jgi:MFS family permease
VSGDIGKLVFPLVAALLISHFDWPAASQLMGLFGVAVALTLVFLAMPMKSIACDLKDDANDRPNQTSLWRGNGPFVALLTIGILDSATRMGFLTYFPFLLRDKGASIALTGLALSLVFAGGVAGKFFCGILATRFGALRTVLITEGLTAAYIWGNIGLPLWTVLVLCPMLGLALNGTSSVLYGSVPELVPPEKRNHSFAVFYTATIGSGAISPILYGFIGDVAGLISTLVIMGTVILGVLPLTLPLRGKLSP